MHNCPPPKDALKDWLKQYPSVEDRYGHLLLEARKAPDTALVDALRPYFESAHLDAREHFHTQIGIDLHPDSDGGEAAPSYPRCLPPTARRGLFGEVAAGLATEAYQKTFLGQHAWVVPIFLFRYHADVEAYLWTLNFDPDRKRQIFGRFGSDFIGVALSDTGEVVRVIAGEAKWRKNLTESQVDGILLGPKKKNKKTGISEHNGRGVWYELNRDTPIPHGLRQLQRLLEARDPDGFAAAILSIDQAIAARDASFPRTNLLVIAGNGAATRSSSEPVIPWEVLPEEYTAPHDLQVVEMILEDGEELIDALYDSLWDAD